MYYGVHAAMAAGLFLGWARAGGYSLRNGVARRAGAAVALGLACAVVLALLAVRAEPATPRPGGLALTAAVIWRGVVYGAADGLLLSTFPILVVSAALGGRARRGGRVLTALVGSRPPSR